MMAKLKAYDFIVSLFYVRPSLISKIMLFYYCLLSIMLVFPRLRILPVDLSNYLMIRVT
jgi:hypothetical protein